MVQGGTITADQSENIAQSRIAIHGQNSNNRHHNRSQNVRRENQQQEPLGDPNTNAWAACETKYNEDEEEEIDDSEKLVSPGPQSSDSESDNSTDNEATDKSKAIHDKDHNKREQEIKKGKQLKRKSDKQKKKL
jgi:hypothetical protein